jgi:hypothetical protein
MMPAGSRSTALRDPSWAPHSSRYVGLSPGSGARVAVGLCPGSGARVAVSRVLVLHVGVHDGV